jgi:hypothetical protein
LASPFLQHDARPGGDRLAGEQLLLHAKRAFAELRHIEADLSALRGS